MESDNPQSRKNKRKQSKKDLRGQAEIEKSSHEEERGTSSASDIAQPHKRRKSIGSPAAGSPQPSFAPLSTQGLQKKKSTASLRSILGGRLKRKSNESLRSIKSLHFQQDVVADKPVTPSTRQGVQQQSEVADLGTHKALPPIPILIESGSEADDSVEHPSAPSAPMSDNPEQSPVSAAQVVSRKKRSKKPSLRHLYREKFVSTDINDDVAREDEELNQEAVYCDYNLLRIEVYRDLLKSCELSEKARRISIEQQLQNTLLSQQGDTANPWRVVRYIGNRGTARKGDLAFQINQKLPSLEFKIERGLGKAVERIKMDRHLREFGGLNVHDRKTVAGWLINFERLANAWPIAANFSSSSAKSMLVRATTALTLDGNQRFLDVRWDHTGCTIRFEYIDESTGEVKALTNSSLLPFTWLHDAPIVADNVTFYRGGSGLPYSETERETLVDGSTCLQTLIPDDALTTIFAKTQAKPTMEELRAREHFQRHIAIWCTGLISTADKLQQLIANLNTQHGVLQQLKNRAGRKEALRGLCRFYQPKHRRSTDIHCSSANLIQRLGLQTDRITQINTRDQRWIAYLINCVRPWLFGTSFDLVKTFTALLETVDEIDSLINAGEEPPALCDCSPDERLVEIHACSVCHEETLCIDLETSPQGHALCQNCTHIGLQLSEESKEAHLRDRLHIAIEKDRKGYGFASNQVNAIVDDCTAVLMARMEGFHHPDFNCEYSTHTARQRSAWNPFNSSIEAPRAFGRLDNDTITTHTPDNVVIVQIWLNYAHYLYHIGFLEEAAKWERSTKSAQAKQHLVDQEDRLHRVSLSWDIFKAARLKRMTKEEYDAVKQNWTSGDPSQLNISDELQYHFFPSRNRRSMIQCAWSEEEFTIALTLMDDMVERHGCREILDKSGDTVWFTPLGQRPAQWNRDTLYTFFYIRGLRVHNTCNARWRHLNKIDNPYTYLLELCWQLCAKASGAGYKSLFDLPMNIWSRSALCSSARPTSIDQRIDAKNNLLIETAFENKSRWNWHPDDVALLPDSLRQVKIPERLYNPLSAPVPVPQSVNEVLRTYAGVEVEDTAFDLPDDEVQLQASQAHARPSRVTKPSTTVSASTRLTSPQVSSGTAARQASHTGTVTPDTTATPQTVLRKPAGKSYATLPPLVLAERNKHDYDTAITELIKLYTTWLGKSPTAIHGKDDHTLSRPTPSGRLAGMILPNMKDIWTIVGRETGHAREDAKQDDPVDKAGDDWATVDLMNFILGVYTSSHMLRDGVWIVPDQYAVALFLGEPGQRKQIDAIRDYQAKNEWRLHSGEQGEFPLMNMPIGTELALINWNIDDWHFILVRLDIDHDMKKVDIIIYDSQYDGVLDLDTQHNHLAIQIFVQMATYKKSSPIHKYQVGLPESGACARQTGGNCGYHVMHNIFELAEGRELNVFPKTLAERQKFGEDLRWEFFQMIFEAITGKALVVPWQRPVTVTPRLASLPSERSSTGTRTSETVIPATSTGSPRPTKSRLEAAKERLEAHKARGAKAAPPGRAPVLPADQDVVMTEASPQLIVAGQRSTYERFYKAFKTRALTLSRAMTVELEKAVVDFQYVTSIMSMQTLMLTLQANLHAWLASASDDETRDSDALFEFVDDYISKHIRRADNQE
ncbi:hypothetical protein AMS68_006789 [Peltaster fructicola]|uniref:Uncharacterized protein n=1 Tax=Peltaster fructicola TaxID=286661 RepID=A0A6H0Y2M4_9PEZI|nr:hypothetical protein AMS68_006789 [Peltaster fructicola]